ncbi:LysR family transcriptional regulator [Fulvimonas soli]|jgi:DNA-binding transcriptional LysR family regulator|uniref:LysR family transcriptional regulator n=1 Tax=Fulvimonas soli TaxID=155197 RepID=A0A316IHJ9_9GAMM|nr:LysR family transcriptional regulator [Fulvimonas soli]PWK92146.1 LysR family transcriptional regulator [Fulvimonas soli]TNY27868.1 LysR family transcriptional regulator [Fulvimonas soli]
MDQLQTIRMFVRVAETGSFTRAADQLQVPRSSVSTAIRRLEEHLDTRLIHRTTRRMQLTPDGSDYLDWCRRLLDEIEQAEARFRRGGGELRGRLRVDAPSRIARRLLVPALPGFLARHPALELELGSTDRPVDLVGEGVDCAIRVGEVRSPHLVARRLGALRQLNCASPGYLARHGTPRGAAELRRHRVVAYASPLTGRVEDFEYLAEGARRTLRLRSQVTVNSAETYAACCLAGLGIIQVPAYDVADELRAGRLVEVLPACVPPPLPLWAVYPGRRHLSPRVRAFVTWVEALFAPHLAPA